MSTVDAEKDAERVGIDREIYRRSHHAVLLVVTSGPP
jgi:hypothetical protein